MSKKGFAISGLIYSILLLFILLIFSILSILQTRKMILDKAKNDVILNLNDASNNFDSKGFKDDSWETIQKIVQSGNANKYYQVGNEKEVELTGYTNGSEKTFTVRIANISNPTECFLNQNESETTTNFSQTACGFVVEFVDIIDKNVMNSLESNAGGWPGSDMYQFLNNETDSIYTKLPPDLQKVIIDTYTVSGHGSADAGDDKNGNFTSTDKLYLLSTKEVWGENPYGYDTAVSDEAGNKITRQLDYYVKLGVNLLNYGGAIKKYQGNDVYWWLRSARSNNDGYFILVMNDGGCKVGLAYGYYGVAPAFRIG